MYLLQEISPLFSFKFLDLGKAMNQIHQEISVLNSKVDNLQTVVKQLNYQLQEFLTQNPSTQFSDSLSPLSPKVTNDYSFGYENTPRENYHYSSYAQNTVDNAIDDNSVLEDIHPQEKYHQNHHLPGLSAELQVQRLTAQLTAAYNRIAALEEQLLARRG
jgi:hypothetical protein